MSTILDTSSPAILLGLVTTPTGTASQTVAGSFVELSPDTLTVLHNNKVQHIKKSFTDTAFTKLLGLTEGDNVIQVVLEDKSGLATGAYTTAAASTGSTADFRTVTAINSSTKVLTLSSAPATAHLVNTPVQLAPTAWTTASSAKLGGSVTVNSASGFSAGDTIQVGINSNVELNTIASISSTVLTLGSALTKDHTANVPVLEATSLANDAAAADTTIVVSDETSFSKDEAIKIGLGSTAEVKIITEIDADNNVLTLDTALANAHTSGAANTPVFHASTVDNIIVDTTGPVVLSTTLANLSNSAVRVGDQFFVLANAADATTSGAVSTGVAQVTAAFGGGSAQALTPIASVPDVIIKKHGLASFNSATTHVGLFSVPTGTPSGPLTITLVATGGGGNTTTAATTITVVATLPDYNVYLLDGFNFIGFPLLATTISLSTLLDQVVTNANPSLESALGGTVKLSDIVESISAWPGGTAAAATFTVFTPGAGTDTLTDIAPFQGMLVKVLTTKTVSGTPFNVFDTAADPTGGSGTVNVPVKWNVAGVFLSPGSVPPSKTLVAAFNLITPHIQFTSTFDNVLRGALIGPSGQLAVSAITQVKRIDALAGTGSVTAEVEEGFTSTFPGGNLEPGRAYWVFIVSGATITP